MVWVVQFKWERKKKVEYGYYERERERENKWIKKKKRKRRDNNLNSPLLLKKKSSKLTYLISFTYRFKIWSQVTHSLRKKSDILVRCKGLPQ